MTFTARQQTTAQRAGSEARFRADLEARNARGPLGNLTPAAQPVGFGSNLTGTGREVQKRANETRRDLARKRRALRLLDRRARKGDAGAALKAVEFANSLGGELSLATGINSSAEINGVAERSLEDDARLRAVARGPQAQPQPAADPTDLLTRPRPPGGPYQEPFIVPDGPVAPGAQNVPPADATDDSATNSATASSIREVPESPVAPDPVPSASPEPAPAPAAPATPTLPQAPALSEAETLEEAAAAVGFDGALQGVQEPALDEGMRRARESANIVAIDGGVPMFRMSTGEVVPFPGGMAELEKRADQERNFMDMEGRIDNLGPNNTQAVQEYLSREQNRELSEGRTPAPFEPATGTPEISPAVGIPQTNMDVALPDVSGLAQPIGNVRTTSIDPPTMGQAFEPSVGGPAIEAATARRELITAEENRRSSLPTGERIGEDLNRGFTQGFENIRTGADALMRFDQRATAATKRGFSRGFDALMRFDQRATAATLGFVSDVARGANLIPGTNTTAAPGTTPLANRFR